MLHPAFRFAKSQASAPAFTPTPPNRPMMNLIEGDIDPIIEPLIAQDLEDRLASVKL